MKTIISRYHHFQPNNKTWSLALLLMVHLFLPFALKAQTVPQGMHYQAVARNEEGNEIRSQHINVRIYILSESVNGVSQWTEEHLEVQTNPFGVFNLEIGNGEHLGGLSETFAEIPWGSTSHFLKIEIDFGGGYRDMGTTQFLSVPYALYSGYAINGGSGGPGGSDSQTLSIDGHQLSISNGNQITLPDSVKDEDADPANEIQNLSLNGRQLSIDRGNSITLPDSVNDADADPTNELQTLSINKDNQLSISNGNTITLRDSVKDEDSDPVNEIQDLTLNGNILTITKNGDANSIDLSAYLDDTDDQQLTFDTVNLRLGITGGNQLNLKHLLDDEDADTTNEMQTLQLDGNRLSISGRNYVDLTDNVNDADADPVNEIQDLSLSGNILTITRNSEANTIDLSPYLDDTDTDEQDLSLVNDTIKITNSSSRVPLTKYLDNTDEQTLELTSDNVLVISGSNDSVDLKVDLVGFKAKKTTTSSIPDPGFGDADTSYILFELTVVNETFGSSYDAANGIFTVPEGQGGLYQFTVTYDFGSNQELYLEKNGSEVEILAGGIQAAYDDYLTCTKLMFLQEFDQIRVKRIAYSAGDSGKGIFSGYRIR